MINYLTITLQLSTLLTLFLLAALAFTITGVSTAIWLLGKLVEGGWWLVEQYTEFKESTKVWQSK